MASVELDLEGLVALLREREHSVPFGVTPIGAGGGLGPLRTAVEDAVDRAYEMSEQRHPDDPTTIYGTPEITLDSIVAMVEDGVMSGEEVAAWFKDLAAALEGHHVRIAPTVVDAGIPWDELGEWAHGPERVPTAFVYLSGEPKPAPYGRSFKEWDHAVVEALSPEIARWVQMRDGTATIGRGGTFFVVPAQRQALELAAHEASHLSARSFTLTPRRHSQVDFSEWNLAIVQAFDELLPREATLEHLLEALRVFGPRADYAVVRMDRPVAPSVRGSLLYLGRAPTEAEDRFNGRAAEQYVVAPGVAQVLAPAHLAKNPDLSAFTVEELGEGRMLVVARDPGAWLSGTGPEPETMQAAEAAFSNLIPSLQEVLDCE